VAVLLVSEIFGNSVHHSGSGAPGETVAVRVGSVQWHCEVLESTGLTSASATTATERILDAFGPVADRE
jgi:tRNA A37 threonylcarbamoyladenosine synthetase subunit TsaC/SUA5/YrdC